MTTLNSYATLQEYKDYAISRGQTASTAATDDSVIEKLLKAASRHIDEQTAQFFTPYVETRYFDVPARDQPDPRVLRLDACLLEVLTLTNGDGTVIPSTEYALRPRNQSPYTAIRLIDNSTYYWASDGAGDTHDVIAVQGVWGYHDRYTQAWKVVTTTSEALDTSETGIDVADGTQVVVGNLIRIENELSYVSAVVSNTLTGTRGENSSAAATHDSGKNVSVWQIMDKARDSVLEIANAAYQRRFGKNTGERAQVTAAGIILSPLDIPVSAETFIYACRNYL